jgi:hypothetical protein
MDEDLFLAIWHRFSLLLQYMILRTRTWLCRSMEEQAGFSPQNRHNMTNCLPRDFLLCILAFCVI